MYGAQVVELLADAENMLEVEIDLESQMVIRECGTKYPFDIDPFRKNNLLNGLDDIGYAPPFLPPRGHVSPRHTPTPPAHPRC